MVFVFWSFLNAIETKINDLTIIENFEIIKISEILFFYFEYFFFQEPHHLILRVPSPDHGTTSHRRSISGIRNTPPPPLSISGSGKILRKSGRPRTEKLGFPQNRVF